MDRKTKWSHRYLNIGITAFLVIAASILFFFLIYRFRGILHYLAIFFRVLQPFIIGLIIAYLVSPLADAIQGFIFHQLEKHCKKNSFVQNASKAAGVFGALAVLILVLLLIIYLIVPQFLESITTLIKTVPDQLDALIDRISNELKKNSKLQSIVLSVYQYGKNWLQTDLTGYVTSAAAYFASGILSVVGFLKDFAVGFIFAIYILFNKTTLLRQVRKLMFALANPQIVTSVVNTGRRANKIFSGFIYGKLLDSVIIGVLCYLGISIMRMPFTVLVAVIIGVTNIIPVFGPYLGAIPCAALILLFDPVKGISFIVFIIVLQALDGNFIGPKILGNSTGLSAFWVVFAIVVAGGFFGVIGMLVGVPVFAVLYYLMTTFVNYRLHRKNMPTESAFYDETAIEKISAVTGDKADALPESANGEEGIS